MRSFSFKEALQLINKKGIIEHHHFASQINDADNDHPTLLSSQKEDRDIMCLSKEER